MVLHSAVGLSTEVTCQLQDALGPDLGQTHDAGGQGEESELHALEEGSP